MSPKKSGKKAIVGEENSELAEVETPYIEIDMGEEPVSSGRKGGRKAAASDDNAMDMGDPESGYVMGNITVAIPGVSEVEEEGRDIAMEEVFNPREYEEMSEQDAKHMRKAYEGGEEDDFEGIETRDNDDFRPRERDEDSYDDDMVS